MAKRFIFLVLGALLSACGSGGGGGGTFSSGAVALDISTQAPAAQTVLYGVQLTVRLPAGATVTANAATGELEAGQLLVKDPSAYASGSYTPATATAPGKVLVIIADPAGFAAGDLATLVCRDPSGGGGGYTLEGFSARDQNGAEIAGTSGRFTVRAL